MSKTRAWWFSAGVALFLGSLWSGVGGMSSVLYAQEDQADPVPLSVLWFWKIERSPGLRSLFYQDHEHPAHGSDGPIFTARCPDDQNGELVAYGCVDICALFDTYVSGGKSEYVFADPAIHRGYKQYRLDYTLYDGYSVPLYFKNAVNMKKCASMLQKDEVGVAYGGWCTAGVEDQDRKLHFSSSNGFGYRWKNQLMPNGKMKWVLYATNLAKTKVSFSKDLQQSAADSLSQVMGGALHTLDIRGRFVPPLLPVYSEEYQPPKEGNDWPLK